jgi:hypothetical protein
MPCPCSRPSRPSASASNRYRSARSISAKHRPHAPAGAASQAGHNAQTSFVRMIWKFDRVYNAGRQYSGT